MQPFLSARDNKESLIALAKGAGFRKAQTAVKFQLKGVQDDARL